MKQHIYNWEVKEFNENTVRSTTESRSEIIQGILEFYRIQPGVSTTQIEKLDEYLLLMNSLFVDAYEDLLGLSYGFDSLEDMVDVLNSYINSIVEESYKVFPKQDLEIVPLNLPEHLNLNEIQILEYLTNMNQIKGYRFGLDDCLTELEENLYEDEFPHLLLHVLAKTIEAINMEMMLKMEELL
ncbi:hypothetical protein [Marinifilum caeruleilacunae]|uniref:Uncharacterized protein n=1 Tax=Marinifilum caeruleilacunae TaxID=2499076 RepID=A0ABX1WR50_9BACT|nr:hypothetical protein [Marinifilum caeruleilacunae]NOU58403.1 hypothetical protein [Marinifilum caeruleilacunae]